MLKRAIAVLVLVALATGACAGGKWVVPPRKADGWTTPLAELGIDGTVDALARPHHWRVKQVSSYDRTGGEFDDRYGHEVFEGGVVLADVMGPGMIARIWTRNPWGTLYIFVDDMEHPIITTPFRELFSGELELFSPGFNLFAPPFVGEGSGGYYCYVPIPFAERCRLVVMGEQDVLGYEVTYIEFPPGVPIRSFELALNHDDVGYFRKWRDTWNKSDMRYHVRGVEQVHKSSTRIWPAKDVLVAPFDGPGTITEFEMKVESADPAILQKLWLQVFFDGAKGPAVLAPIGDFFGRSSPDSSNYNSVVLGNLDGRMWCRFPMPFRKSAVVRVVNNTDQMVDFWYTITWRPGAVDDANYFFARYRSAAAEAGTPYTVADISGKGTFVGAAIASSGSPTLTLLEGDPQYRIDGAPASEFHGTGTDAYFNGGWYFAAGPYSGALSGCTSKNAGRPAAFAAYRTHVMDAVPFTSSFSFTLEHGTGNNQPGARYTSVAYWYQREVEPELWAVPEFSPPVSAVAARASVREPGGREAGN